MQLKYCKKPTHCMRKVTLFQTGPWIALMELNVQACSFPCERIQWL